MDELKGYVGKQRKDGLFPVVLDLPSPPEGPRNRKSEYAKTKEEGYKKLQEMRLRYGAGALSEDMNFGAFAEKWIAHLQTNVDLGVFKSNSLVDYRDTLYRHVIRRRPAATDPLTHRKDPSKSFVGLLSRSGAYEMAPFLGCFSVRQVNGQAIRNLLDALAKDGRKGSILKHVHNALAGLFAFAQEDGVVAPHENPMLGRKAPKVKERDLIALTLDEAKKLLAKAHSEHSIYQHLFCLALYLGMREGELIALRWENVDLDAGFIYVTENMVEYRGKIVGPGLVKSKPSARQLPLLPPIRSALMAQKATLLAMGLLRADRKGGACQLVFPNFRGEPLRKGSLLRAYKRLLHLAALPINRIHDLRHTTATLLMELNPPLPDKVIGAILGHSDFNSSAMTKKYQHVRQASPQMVEGLARLQSAFSQ